MKLSSAAAALLFLTSSAANAKDPEYLALRGQKRRAAVVGFEDESSGDVQVELPQPDMGEAEEDFPVPDVYSRSEEFGLMDTEGEDPEDDGTSEGGTGPNEPGYKEGMEPPEAHEKEPITDSDPCGALGADPDPSSAAYAKCMEEGNKPAPEGEIPVPDENAPPGAIVPEKKAPVEEAPVEEAPEKKAPVEEAPVEESASLQYETSTKGFTTLDVGDEDTIMKPLLPSEAKVVTKTITLEYADGTKATVMETFPEPAVPTESPVPNPDPSI